MSVQALGWVFDHSPTKGTDRLVLLAIANHAGGTELGGAYEAYPGIELIMHECRIDRRRTVTDAIGRLIDGGHLERVVNGAPDERIPAHRRPNLYRIRLAGGVSAQRTPPEPWGAGQTSDGVSAERPMGCAQAAPKPSENRQEPLLVQEARATVVAFDADAANPEGSAFERFWKAYPRKHDKGRARKAWAKAVAASGGDPEPIVSGAERFAADPNREDSYTPHGATWLNGERWGDPPLPVRQQRGGGRRPPRQVAQRRDGVSEVQAW